MRPSFLVLTIVFFGLVGVLLVKWRWPTWYGSVIFCDVGQGDAILFQQGWTQLLIDTGPDSKVSSCLEKYMPWQDTTIELVVLTHPDADHLGGFLSLVPNYYLQNIWITSAEKDTELWQEVLEEIQALQAAAPATTVAQPVALEAYQLGQNIQISVVNPLLRVRKISGREETVTETKLSDTTGLISPLETEPNDESIALYIDFMGVNIFVTGDIEEKRELALIKHGLIQKADILKGAHHGSKTSTNQQFLMMVEPELYVVSSGKNNRFGHPAPEVMQRLKLLEIPVVSTSEEGDIQIRLFDNRWWIATR